MNNELAMSSKLPEAYKTIGEASEFLALPQHVLRFWEEKFRQLSPAKRRGRRYYTPDDMHLLSTIKRLLYEEGYTIKGVQHYLDKHMSVVAHPKTAEPLTDALLAPRIVEKEELDVVYTVLQHLKAVRKKLSAIL